MMDEYMVRNGVWDDKVKIAWVGAKRHTVIFPDRECATTVTYCNNCGSPFLMASSCGGCGEDMREPKP